MMRLWTYVLALGAVAGAASVADGGFTLIQDFAEWQQASGPYVTLDFTGFSDGVFITDQYAPLGVTFLDGNDNIAGPSSFVFPLDGWGLDVNASGTMEFASPQYTMGVHHPGVLQIQLYWHGNLIYESPILPGGGVGFFAGVLSDVPFDSAVILNPLSPQLSVDNIYFGIPTPAAVVPLLLGGLLAGNRSRCRRNGPTSG